MDFIFFAAGLAGIYIGAELVILGVSSLTLALGVTSSFLASTLVAYGTSSPEGLVSLVAAFKKIHGVSIGNIIGSNIANIALVLGLSALVSPMSLPKEMRKDIPFMLVATFLFHLLCLNGGLEPWEGVIMFAGFILFTFTQFAKRRDGEANLGKASKVFGTTSTIVGLAILVSSAWLLVFSGTRIAKLLGVSELLIAITMMAVGTSIPELAVSLVATLRKRGEISVGNVVGSNIFNVLGILGLVAIISTPNVGRLDFELAGMSGFALAMLIMSLKSRFSRLDGFLLLSGYILFIWKLL